MEIRPIQPEDREPLASLLKRTAEFTTDEVACALELIDAAIVHSPDYDVLVATVSGAVSGYICFGPTPMTKGTYDLYWIATDAGARRHGVGRSLVRAFEDAVRRRSGRLVRVETSSQEAYAATRRFYVALDYSEEARLRDFYDSGDDLVVLTRRLPASSK